MDRIQRALLYIEENDLDLFGSFTKAGGYIYTVTNNTATHRAGDPIFSGCGGSIVEAVAVFRSHVTEHIIALKTVHERDMAMVLRLIGGDIGIGL